jgi:ferredoxin
MSVRLAALERWTPDALSRRLLDELTGRVAEAFGVTPPEWPSRNMEARLEEFARFTATAAGCTRETTAGATAGRLRLAACGLGADLRRPLGVRSPDEARRALQLLYRELGIALRAGADGTVTVSRCRFSRHYSPGACRLMCAVDEGIAAGLTGGWRLSFDDRLTEGAAACRGRLEPPLPDAHELTVPPPEPVAEQPMPGGPPPASLARRGRPVRAVVVGSGAGGATIARELAGLDGVQVTVLEAGRRFCPFTLDREPLERVRSSGLFFDERLITALFPAMRVQRAADGLVLVRGVATGGTTTLATGNAMRLDAGLSALGIDLTSEYRALETELGVTSAHRGRWRPSTQVLWDACRQAGLAPQPTPKMVDYRRCVRCGRCVLGCRTGARWDARRFLDDASARGATVLTGARVERLQPAGDRSGRAGGVLVRRHARRELVSADVIVLAAGGLGTPAILARSGVATENRLFVDPVLCVAGPWPGADQDREVPMPFVVELEGSIVSPYFDHLSFFFDRRWRREASGLASLMIKLADSEVGDVGRGSMARDGVRKALTPRDRRRLRDAVDVCRDVLAIAGIPLAETFLGTLNAGHPGGMASLTVDSAATMHPRSLPSNVFVADASLLPESLGAAPMLTIMALARRLATVLRERDVV